MARNSTDPKVQKFITEIEVIHPEKYRILQKLREIVFAHIPEVTERMMYGGIMLNAGYDFGGFFVYEKHVSFEFGKGYRFDDPEKLLEGKGKFRRHLKFRTLDDIKTKNDEIEGWREISSKKQSNIYALKGKRDHLRSQNDTLRKNGDELARLLSAVANGSPNVYSDIYAAIQVWEVEK